MEHYDTDIQARYAERATESITGRWHMAEKVILHVELPMMVQWQESSTWSTMV